MLSLEGVYARRLLNPLQPKLVSGSGLMRWAARLEPPPFTLSPCASPSPSSLSPATQRFCLTHRSAPVSEETAEHEFGFLSLKPFGNDSKTRFLPPIFPLISWML